MGSHAAVETILSYGLRAPAACSWAHQMIELDILRCEIVQRESYLIEKCRQATEPVENGDHLYPQEELDQQKLDEWHEELKTLNQDYWSLERRIYANDKRCPDPPLKRAYMARDNRRQWYLCRWLREDCAKRGG